ncbi:MAG: Asp-tRNA(Asn)/Glu-tRNA(Gln) amidotransferase subunit GatC [Thermoanaerobaculia bacterium]|nr:Asp-tRNA(Asn)/Glu-tRNA(Gln) amidotransferase subunit GatC [Thermoanaerobaculia bacterium]
MKIDREEARRIAGLAHLEFDEPSLEQMASEMTAILGYIEMLRDADVTETAADREPTPLRDDVTRPSTDRALVEKNAPSFENGFFVVPKVIE